jgi:type I restriction enzyme S subunit
MSLPRYPKYKDSGVEWLGEVPEHWEISRLGYEAWVRARLGWKGLKAEEYVDDGFAFLSTPNIKGIAIDFDNVNFIDQHRFDESPEIKLCEGDVLLAKDGSTLGTVNVVRTLPRPTTVNSSIAVITPNPRLNGVYLFYLFDSSFMENTIQRIKGGMGVPHLFQADLNKFFLPIPPRTEQIRIAGFLDRETAKIDALVSEQQRLIELLKEKRQTVISHAVTKGLDKNARMKPSGIEWLGDVPKHWAVTPLKRLADVHTGVAKGKDNSSLKTISVPYLRVANVQDGYLDLEDVSMIDIPVKELERYALKPGDVLMNEGGDFDKLGRGYIWEGQIAQCISQNHVFAVRPRKVESRWLNAITGSDYAQFYFMTRSKQSTNLASISSTNLMDLPVVHPPESEQSAILSFISEQTAHFDALTTEAQRAIDLLQERRTALISAAVTGKIDVRGLVRSEIA